MQCQSAKASKLGCENWSSSEYNNNNAWNFNFNNGNTNNNNKNNTNYVRAVRDSSTNLFNNETVNISYTLYLEKGNFADFYGDVFIPMKKKQFYLNNITTVFTFNWFKDIDADGLDIEDFHGVKRSFYEDEKILFLMGYTTELEGKWKFEIYESLTGKSIYTKNGNTVKGAQTLCIIKEGEKLPVGVYLYYFSLITENEEKVSKSEKFEILKQKETE